MFCVGNPFNIQFSPLLLLPATVVVVSAGTLWLVHLAPPICLMYAAAAALSLVYASYTRQLQRPLEMLKQNTELLLNEKDALQQQVVVMEEVLLANNERGEELAEKICTAQRRLRLENDRHTQLNQQQARLLAIDLFVHFDTDKNDRLEEEELQRVIAFLHLQSPVLMQSILEKQSMSMEDLVELLWSLPTGADTCG